jgi:hypothetical protein
MRATCPTRYILRDFITTCCSQVWKYTNFHVIYFRNKLWHKTASIRPNISNVIIIVATM